VPWSRSLLVRLLAPYGIALVAVATSLYWYGDAVVERLYLDTLARHTLLQAQLVGRLLPPPSSSAELDPVCAELGRALGARLTVIAADGTVRGDSDAPSRGLENHRDRPEVRAAWLEGDGRSVRRSASVGRALFYRAWRQELPDGRRVIRLGVPIETIASVRDRIRWAIIGGVALAALAAFWPAYVLARRLSRRIARLAEFSEAVARSTPPPALVPQGDDIITSLERNLGVMAETLQSELLTAREEAGKLEAVLGGMVEGVIVLDRSGTVRLANQRAEQLLGSGSQPLVDQPLINVSRDPDLLELLRTVTRAEQNVPIAREIHLERPRREILNVTATPMMVAHGRPGLFILVFHDITEMKKVEAMRRDFVANVSHELRTPLTSIRGYTETLQAGAVNNPELAAKFLGVIERHSERLSRLVDDLLILSDLELGRAALQRSSLPLAEVLDAAFEILRDKAEKAAVTIRRTLPEGLPPLYADADRIEQVLVNLIDNAIKYTPAGGSVSIDAEVIAAVGEEPSRRVATERAETSRTTDGEPWIEIRVADTGIGVPKHDLPRLTERFYRVDKARSRELGGTGLGLAIVKHIVQAHGGRLRIDSEPGQGTTVRVQLPLHVPGERTASWKR